MTTATKARGKSQAEDKTRPVHKARMGSLQCAVWGNEHTDEETGDVRVFHTINIERNFRDRDGDWQKTSQLRSSDLGEAIALLQNAQQFLVPCQNQADE